MSKFDFMGFGFDAGRAEMLVVSAKKHKKEEVLEIFEREYGDRVENGKLRQPIDKDIEEVSCAFRFGVSPEWPDGCYTFVGNKERGAFPVYVIEFRTLRV